MKMAGRVKEKATIGYSKLIGMLGDSIWLKKKRDLRKINIPKIAGTLVFYPTSLSLKEGNETYVIEEGDQVTLRFSKSMREYIYIGKGNGRGRGVQTKNL